MKKYKFICEDNEWELNHKITVECEIESHKKGVFELIFKFTTLMRSSGFSDKQIDAAITLYYKENIEEIGC